MDHLMTPGVNVTKKKVKIIPLLYSGFIYKSFISFLTIIMYYRLIPLYIPLIYISYLLISVQVPVSVVLSRRYTLFSPAKIGTLFPRL
jgi:carbon starvation protein CstA